MIISIGQYLNHLARPNVTIATNPAASAKFPVARIKDGYPSIYMQFGPVPTAGIDGGTLNRTGTINLTLLKNPGAELGLVGWVKGGTVVATTAQFYSGAKSWQIAADGYLYQDIHVRSGELMRITGATRGDGASAEAYFGVMNVETGQALSTAGTWVTPDTEVGTGTARVAYIKKLGAQTTAAWLPSLIQFTAEPYTSTLRHLTRLRIVAACGGAGNGFVDDLVVVPATDMCSIHGFNFPANMIVTVYSSDTGAFGGEEALRFTLTPFQPSFYEWLAAPFLARYLKFVLLGVRERLFLPYIGELIFTQMVELEISGRYGSTMRAEWLKLTSTTGKGRKKVIATFTSSRPVRSVNFPFRWFAESHYAQGREWFTNRCRGEQEDILIAAPEFESQAIIYGRMSGPRGFALFGPDVRDAEAVTVTEMDLPQFPAGEVL